MLTLIAAFSFCGVSCTPTQKSVGTGAAAGAVLGTIIADGDNHKKGALIGAAAGAAAGAAVGRNKEKKKYYY
ncbi:MAG: YMGG-like glycine zipper-containing protein [Verrucomicrobiales bacterium]|nr:YMGG-like glycine zipper-containing protein [Verrucomicrobiales bacterium]